MTPEENAKIIEYVDSFTSPAETAFFTSEQTAVLISEREKLEASRKMVASIIEQENFEDLFQKAVLENRIYSLAQANLVDAKLAAIDFKEGDRVNLSESLVSKSGQFIIAGASLQKRLGLITDDFFTKDDAEFIFSCLKVEGFADADIDRVGSAINKYGAVIVQRGAYEVLKPTLEEALGKRLTVGSAKAAEEYGPATKATAPIPTTNLPNGFIEYLKNNDKEYDIIAHDIAQDEKFMELFDNLKKHYPYYQKLPVEKMVQEIMVHPPLWIKLNPQNRARLQTIVEKHRQDFDFKTQEIAKTVHAEKLDEIKIQLGK